MLSCRAARCGRERTLAVMNGRPGVAELPVQVVQVDGGEVVAPERGVGLDGGPECGQLGRLAGPGLSSAGKGGSQSVQCRGLGPTHQLPQTHQVETHQPTIGAQRQQEWRSVLRRQTPGLTPLALQPAEGVIRIGNGVGGAHDALVEELVEVVGTVDRGAGQLGHQQWAPVRVIDFGPGAVTAADDGHEGGQDGGQDGDKKQDPHAQPPCRVTCRTARFHSQRPTRNNPSAQAACTRSAKWRSLPVRLPR